MEYYVIGGEFSSLNFHTYTPGTTIIRGPFPERIEAQEAWKVLSEQYRHMASYRFVITENK